LQTSCKRNPQWLRIEIKNDFLFSFPPLCVTASQHRTVIVPLEVH